MLPVLKSTMIDLNDKIRFVILFLLPVLFCENLYETSDNSQRKEYCQWETFVASCSSSTQVVMISSAKYGRMGVGRCLAVDYYNGCYADVTDHMTLRCSGRSSCSVAIPDPEMFQVQPCRKDLVAYLECSFTCVEVLNHVNISTSTSLSSSPTPSSSSSPCSQITAPSGWLSSSFLEKRNGGWGRAGCPWSIRALLGQRISLTLNDFTDYSSLHFGSFKEQTSCPIIFIVSSHVAESSQSSISSCDSKLRRRLAYISEGHEVFIHVPMETERITSHGNSSGKGIPNFMIHFQAVGCATTSPPLNGWLERRGENMLIACNHTNQKWFLVCKDNAWVGHYGNCSSPDSNKKASSEHKEERFLFFKLDEMSNVPIGLILAVVIGTIAGMLIGCFLLVILFFFKQRVPSKLKAKDRSSFHHHHPDTPAMTSSDYYPQNLEQCQECSFSSLFKDSEHSFQHDLSTVRLETSKYIGNEILDDPIILNKERELTHENQALDTTGRQTYALVETFNDSKSTNFSSNAYFSNYHPNDLQTVLF